MKILLSIIFTFTAFQAGYSILKTHANSGFKKVKVAVTNLKNKRPVPSLKLLATAEKKFVIGKGTQEEAIYFQHPKTLKQVYKDYFPVGAAVIPETDLNNSAVALFIKTQFSSLTAKQAMQPFWVHPSENCYRWAEADKLVEFAQQNNLKVRGHCLIYSSRKGHMPEWFLKDGSKPATKDLILKRMKDHITAEVTRYKGKIYCWDVVNESISNKSREYFHADDPLFQLIGEEYVAKAFEYAHVADPNAKLFYNDNFDEHNKQKRDKIFNLLKSLKDRGVQIDGIGMQCHLGITGISREYLQETINLFKSIGLEFQITELDISIYQRYLKADQLAVANDSYTPEIQNKQALCFKMIFEVCRQNKGTVTGITCWGSADNDNEKNSLTKRLGKKNYPLLFDANLKPKKAVSEITEF